MYPDAPRGSGYALGLEPSVGLASGCYRQRDFVTAYLFPVGFGGSEWRFRMASLIPPAVTDHIKWAPS